MPYLDSKEMKLEQVVKELPSGKIYWKISLIESDLALWIAHLEVVFCEQVGELRLDLPHGSTLFWKLNETGSKLFVAHSDERIWVGTLALAPIHGGLFLKKLKMLQKGQEVSLAELAQDLHFLSNLELVFSLKA